MLRQYVKESQEIGPVRRERARFQSNRPLYQHLHALQLFPVLSFPLAGIPSEGKAAALCWTSPLSFTCVYGPQYRLLQVNIPTLTKERQHTQLSIQTAVEQ